MVVLAEIWNGSIQRRIEQEQASDITHNWQCSWFRETRNNSTIWHRTLQQAVYPGVGALGAHAPQALPTTEHPGNKSHPLHNHSLCIYMYTAKVVPTGTSHQGGGGGRGAGPSLLLRHRRIKRLIAFAHHFIKYPWDYLK